LFVNKVIAKDNSSKSAANVKRRAELIRAATTKKNTDEIIKVSRYTFIIEKFKS